MENPAGNFEVFQGWKRRISRARFDHVNGTDFSSLDGVKKAAIGGIETTVETTHKNLAHLKGKNRT